MTNTFKKSFTLIVLMTASTLLVLAKDPTTTLDVAAKAGSADYYTLDAVPNIKDSTWVGYNSTGSGSGGCITASHWKLSNSRTINFKIKNCQKIEVNAYFTKDATTNLKYTINNGNATDFATNGTLKKTCASGDFSTNNTGEITITISADNDVILGEIKFYKAGTPGGGDDPTPGGGDDPTPGGGDDPTPGGGDTPTPSGSGFDEIIKVVLSGERAATQTVTGSIGGTSAVKNMGSNSPYKLNSDGAYVSLVLASGSFEATDTLIIDGSKKMLVYYGTAGEGTELLTTDSPVNGIIRTPLTGLPANQNSIYVYRSTSTFNGTLTYMAVHRPAKATPIDTIHVTNVSLDKTSIEIEVGKTEQLTATVLPDNATDKSVTWTSDTTNIATVSTSGVVSAKAEGTATITVTTKDGNKTATCQVTVKPSTTPIVAVTGVSLDKTSATIEVGGNLQLNATVAPDDATNKTLSWASDKTAVASVDQNGKITAVAEGTAKITVTTADGDFKAECNVTVNKKSTPVPQTDLTCHTPEIYEAKGIEGGYDGSLTTFNNREYEVYYVCRDASGSNISIATEPMDKTDGLTTGTDKTVQAKDGWFKLSGSNGKGGDSNAAAKDEFTSSSIQCVKMQNGHEFTFHVQGFDQFSFYGKDNNKDASKGKHFEVYIDNQKVSGAPVDGYAIHRYDMSTSEHVIRLVGLGGSDSKLTGFSLRVAEEPRTKYFKGNDTTQVILQTQAPLPVYYITKYYKKGLPEILWDGNAAEGISLKQKAQSDLRDTSYISGVANCPVGEYKYYIVTKMNGVETSRSQQGKFSVIRKVEFKNKRDTFCFVNQETAITPIVIRYYSNDDEAISLEWTSATQPAESEISVKQDKDANTLTISGTPTNPADYSYVVRLTDAEPIKGIIRVKSNTPTRVDGADKTMLFLTRTEDEQPTGMGSYLDTKYNYLHRAAASKTGSVDSYKAYNFVVISENVDADNAEALALIRGEVNIPVLNMKAFTYAPERVSKDGWGEPDNGTLKKEDGVYITVQRDDHPIFKALGKKQGDKIQVLDSINQKGLMPININNCDGSLALATAYPRDINNYYESAAYQQTIIHEIPAGSDLRNGNSSKYICFPIATSSSNILTADGKKLLTQIIDYLTTAGQTAISTPELKITSFSIDGVAAKIGEDQIVLELDTVAHKIDLSKAKPAIQVASPYTHAEPLDGEEVNFKNSVWAPVVYTVTDYINRRTYDVIVRAYNPQGIEETYVSGEWVNIYDIYGRLIATTNEDIYQIDLPRGMYIVVTANGGTLKIMK